MVIRRMPLICLRNHRILVYFSLQLVSLTAWALMLRVHCLVGVSDICFNFKTRLMGSVRNHPSMFSRLRPFLEHPQCWVMLFSCTAQPSDQTDVATHVPQTISNRCLTTVAWHLGGSTLCARAFSCLSCTCHRNHLCKVQRPWIKSQGDRPLWVWLVAEQSEQIIPDLCTLLLQDKYYLWMCYQDCHFPSCNTHRRIQLFLTQPIKPRRALRKTYHRLLAFWVQPQGVAWWSRDVISILFMRLVRCHMVSWHLPVWGWAGCRWS